MAKKRTLPKTIFVKIEHDGTTSYLVADDDIDSLAGMGEVIKIGTYKLVEVSEAKGVVQIVKHRR